MQAAAANQALVERFYDAIGAGDLEGGFAMLAPDVTWTYLGPTDRLPFAGVFRGREGVRTFFEKASGAIDVKELPIERVQAVDSAVYVRGSEHSDVKSTGKTYRVDFVHVFEVRDGSIVSFTEYLDTATVVGAFA